MFNKRGRIIYTVGTQLATWNEGCIISSEYDLRTWEDRLSWNAECGGTWVWWYMNEYGGERSESRQHADCGYLIAMRYAMFDIICTTWPTMTHEQGMGGRREKKEKEAKGEHITLAASRRTCNEVRVCNFWLATYLIGYPTPKNSEFLVARVDFTYLANQHVCRHHAINPHSPIKEWFVTVHFTWISSAWVHTRRCGVKLSDCAVAFLGHSS